MTFSRASEAGQFGAWTGLWSCFELTSCKPPPIAHFCHVVEHGQNFGRVLNLLLARPCAGRLTIGELTAVQFGAWTGQFVCVLSLLLVRHRPLFTFFGL